MSNYEEFRLTAKASLKEMVEPDISDIKQSDERYLVGVDETGEYVSKDIETGKLLDSEALLLEKGFKIDWARKFEPFF